MLKAFLKQKNKVTTAMIKIVLLFLSLMMPLSALAAPDLVASELQKQDRGPVEVEADKLEVDDQKQLLVFSGNAVAIQGDVEIHGNRIVVFYQGESREVARVVAEGSVRIVQGTRVATGQKAILYRLDERVVLTGSPKVTDGDNFVQGQEITIYLNDKRSVISGGTGGRVNAVFTPQAEEKP